MRFLFVPAFCLAAIVQLSGQSGTLDSDFGDQGKVLFVAQPVLNKAYGVLEQADHKILIAGYALSNASNVMELMRLNSDGTPDIDFGQNGMIEVPLGTDALCYAMALQTDGRILLAGGASTAANGSKDFAVLRFLAEGEPDDSFSGDGIQTISFGSGDDVARAISVQTDGKMVVAGTSTTGNNSLMAIVRLQTDGTPDPTFSGDGKNTVGIGTIFTNAYAMAIQPDGRIILGGSAKFGMQDDVALARFTAGGSLDLTFGSGGQVVTNLGSDADSGNALALQPDGKILVAGISGTSRDFVLLRYLPEGVLDPEFAGQGIVKTDFDGSDDYANAILIQPDEKILVGGYTYQGAIPDFALARYLKNGSPDPDFGNQGLVNTDFEGGYDYAFPLCLQGDGKLLQAGYSFGSGHTAFAITRYITGLQVGVLNLSDGIQVLVAPNPIAQHADLSFTTPVAGLFTLELMDAEGKLVHTFFTQKHLDSGPQALALDFPPGMNSGWYTLILKGLGQVWSLKIIKA